MFLFLSKLIPLFIYPVGLTCLLLIAAMFNFWKKPQRAAGFLVIAFTVLWVSASPWVANRMVRSLERQYPPLTNPPQASAIVVLGGATYAPNPPRLRPEVNEQGDRVLYGAKLYRDGKAPRVILSGGRIDWKDGGPPESADMATLITTMGVPATAILQDQTSLNTIENAMNVRTILEQEKLQGPLLLVTSAMHMPRSAAIFKKQGMDIIPAPTDFLVETEAPSGGFQGAILGILPEAESLEMTTKTMKEYVGLLIYRLRGWL
jgi:uncharacterized SAM-binding protein YcdF (DUF218 family)